MAGEAIYYGTGRRKNAVARVRIVPGTGKAVSYTHLPPSELLYST